MAHPEALHASLKDHFGERILASRVEYGEVDVEFAPDDLLSALTELRDGAAFRFEQLLDVFGVDYIAYGQDEWITEEATDTGFSRGVHGEATGARMGLTGIYGVQSVQHENTGRRFAAVYPLLSLSHNHRLRVRCYAEEDDFPVLPSVTGVWPSANWPEREVFDLFGIVFDGHPDLRRLLTDYGFVGHPFRKDFPLIGNVEPHYDPERQRVVYGPVEIEPRVLVPRVVRDDSRYEGRDEALGGRRDG